MDIRKNGQVYKTYTGDGSAPLIWDGLLNGAAVPEGKYNLVLKNAKQPGKGRERDVVQVGVDMTPPEVYQAKLKSSLQQISFKIKEPLSGVIQNAIETRFRDSETQTPVQIDFQWLKLGSPDWMMQTNNTEDFQKVKQSDIFLLVKDHAGNSAEHQLDFNSDITLNSAVIDEDGTIVLKGVILDKSKSFQVLNPVFDNNIELLGAPEVTLVNNRFAIKITDYKYSDSYLEEPAEGEIVDVNQNVMVSVDACSSGDCLSSSQLPLRQERCNLDAPDESVDFMSSCKGQKESDGFGIQQVRSAPSVRRAFYIHGGKAHNKEIPLILRGKNASKKPIPVTYGLGKSLGGGRYLWLKTLSQRQTIAAGASLQIVAPWDGTGSSGGNLASGEYVTLIDSPGYMTNSTKVTVGCEGYYDHYPKRYTPDRLAHANFRHNRDLWDNGFRQIFLNRINDVYPTTDSFTAAVRNYYWSRGNNGKESLYPSDWGSNKIQSTALSITNGFNSSDTCIKQKNGGYRLHGTRDGVYIRVDTFETADINTSYPPSGPKAAQFYLSPEGRELMGLPN